VGLRFDKGSQAFTSVARTCPTTRPAHFQRAPTSTCSFDSSGFWWLRLASPALLLLAAGVARRDGPERRGRQLAPATARPAACAVAGGTLFVAVSGAPVASTVTVDTAAPALPTNTSGLASAAVASLVALGGAVSGVALSADAPALYVAVAGGGV